MLSKTLALAIAIVLFVELLRDKRPRYLVSLCAGCWMLLRLSRCLPRSGCRWMMPVGGSQPGTCAPGWISPHLTGALWMAMPFTVPTRPGRGRRPLSPCRW